MRAFGPFVVTALLGCGRINYDPVLPGGEPPIDALAPVEAAEGADAAAAVDAETPDEPDVAAPRGDAAPAACTRSGFSAPQLLQIDGLDPDLNGPRLGAEGATLFLSQTHGLTPFFKDEDLWTVLRTAAGAAHFDHPTRLDVLNSAAFDGSAFPTADGLEIIFSSARVGGPGNRDLWLSRRASPTGAWGPPAAITEVDSANDDQNPSLTGDGLALFFSSDREGTKGREDIYTAFRASRASRFSNPVRMAELSSGNKDGAPFATADGLTIYFTSNRPGGKGGIDVWTAQRPSRTVPFAPPVPLAAVNSVLHDDDPSISADGRELFFSSNRDGKNYRIYRSVRCP